MEQLIPVAEMYMEHPNIHGAAIWTVQQWQGSDINRQVRGLIPYLRDAALRYAKEIPDEQPSSPVIVFTTKDTWPFSILTASVEEAKNKHKVTTEEFGIDVAHFVSVRFAVGGEVGFGKTGDR